MSDHDSQGRTWLCSVVFLDIAGYTGRPVEQQIQIKRHFQEVTTEAIHDIPDQDRILIDTGDGAALCFFGDPEEALFVALNIRAGVVSGAEMLSTPYQLRTGINLGPVKVVQSISGQRNPLGDGINNAQRIMSFADPNQILVGRSFYDVVACLSRDHAQIFHHLGERRDKHVKAHDVYEVRLTGNAPATPVSRTPEHATTGWTPVQLAELCVQLAAHIGPMAKVLVQRAMANATSLEELYQALAPSIPNDADRRAFLGHAAESHPTPETEATESPDCPSCRDPERLTQLTTSLAVYLGPLARVLVNRAAQSANNEAALIEQLSAELENDADARNFQKAAKRIFSLTD